MFRDITKERGVDKVKTEFVSLASHQLLGPIIAMKWSIETLLSGDVGPISKQQRVVFEEIYQSCNRMADLVDTLLHVSRLELGTLAMKPEPVNVVTLISRIIAEHKTEIKKRNISLSTHFAKDIPTISVDQNLLRMVVVNIFSNALKYTPPKGAIECSVWNEKAGKDVNGREIRADSILIKVADTGCGIPSHQQDKIFSKLFRADNAQALNVGGTGLGLYIVKQIIDRFGGLVWFESQEQKGTTFFVAIPLILKNH